MYKIGDVFIAFKNYPFGIEEEVEKEESRYDIMDGEEFKIVNVRDGLYEVYNNSCDTKVWTLMTEEEIADVIS